MRAVRSAGRLDEPFLADSLGNHFRADARTYGDGGINRGDMPADPVEYCHVLAQLVEIHPAALTPPLPVRAAFCQSARNRCDRELA